MKILDVGLRISGWAASGAIGVFLSAKENNDGSLHDTGVKGLGLVLKKLVRRLFMAVFLDVGPAPFQLQHQLEMP